MDRNKLIILGLIVVIVLLAVALFSVFHFNAKTDTKVVVKSNSTMYEGDSLMIMLSDANGTGLANQTVNITVTDKDNSGSHYSVVTNAKGLAKLEIDKSAGEYNVALDYGGNDKYAASNATKSITVKKAETTATPASSSSASSGNMYSITNLPPTNDPYPETSRYYLDENHVKQEYADGYMRSVDLRTGKIHSMGFK